MFNFLQPQLSLPLCPQTPRVFWKGVCVRVLEAPKHTPSLFEGGAEAREAAFTKVLWFQVPFVVGM